MRVQSFPVSKLTHGCCFLTPKVFRAVFWADSFGSNFTLHELLKRTEHFQAQLPAVFPEWASPRRYPTRETADSLSACPRGRLEPVRACRGSSRPRRSLRPPPPQLLPARRDLCARLAAATRRRAAPLGLLSARRGP